MDVFLPMQLVAGLVRALQLAGSSKAALALAGNTTAADLADAIVGGIAMAAQPCGPPDALSGSSGCALSAIMTQLWTAACHDMPAFSCLRAV